MGILGRKKSKKGESRISIGSFAQAGETEKGDAEKRKSKNKEEPPEYEKVEKVSAVQSEATSSARWVRSPGQWDTPSRR